MATTVEYPVSRAERADKGTIKASERDIYALGWLSEMRAAWEPDVGVLLGRYQGRRPAAKTVRGLVDRWRRADWATAQVLMVGRPRIVRLLAGGAGLVSGEAEYRESAMWTAVHAAMVAHVRLWLESGAPGAEEELGGPFPPVAEWESERSHRARLYAELGRPEAGRRHVPDGIATLTNGKRVAVEVERTEKAARRLDGIVEQLTDPDTGYDLTLYVASSSAIAGQVKAVHERVAKRAAARSSRGRGALVVTRYPEGGLEG